jgi:hypothetical protein
MQGTPARDIPERVATFIAVSFGVRHFPDAYAIEDDPDHAGETHFVNLLGGECGVNSRDQHRNKILRLKSVHPSCDLALLIEQNHGGNLAYT